MSEPQHHMDWKMAWSWCKESGRQQVHHITQGIISIFSYIFFYKCSFISSVNFFAFSCWLLDLTVLFSSQLKNCLRLTYCFVNPKGPWLPEDHMLKFWCALAHVIFFHGILPCNEISQHVTNASKVTGEKKILLGSWRWRPTWALLTASCNNKQVALLLYFRGTTGWANSSSEKGRCSFPSPSPGIPKGKVGMWTGFVFPPNISLHYKGNSAFSCKFFHTLKS